ncbi:unnamed protein product [Hermetia illucens]|uniref:Serine protease K12H4.7 n=1 Tax=Hermetia illucens TaxID=343691 RepID=A0A7R8V7M0_HERIL|nr:thymus-specific serine protease-like [Hermetia illucens]CAD7093607.1 unnamed protein product [Hermetia illucens]
MKVLALLLAIYLIEVNGQFSPFRKIFQKLHEEPPPPVPVFRNNINMNYIEQKLDHFDLNEKRTWQMRYLSNDYYFKPNGPIFIYVGGEWTISEGSLRGGHMFDMAKELNGYMFYTEHRYYGRSHPFAELTTANLKYLHVKQALADLAHFITTMKSTISGLENSKVILVGGSYSATMVTWFSRLYPNLVNGAWASSAPLQAKVDFVEYKEVTGQSIRQVGGDACYIRIENAIKILEEDFANGDLTNVKKYINVCQNFDTNNKLDVWTFFSAISDIFAGVVQTHNSGSIENMCSLILAGNDDIAGLGNFLKAYLGYGSQCVDITYEADVAELKQTKLSDDMMRQWYYQTCNEYGWYQTSGSSDQPFGSSFPVELYTKLCHDVYDMQFSAESIEDNVQQTNIDFGALKPGVNNVYFTHGSLDPWHAMGLLCEGECGTVIPMYAHCKDLASSSSADTEEMSAAKSTIFKLVKKWVE